MHSVRRGQGPPLPEGNTIATYADAPERFMAAEGLEGVDLVGSSVGARLVLELARRGADVILRTVTPASAT